MLRTCDTREQKQEQPLVCKTANNWRDLAVYDCDKITTDQKTQTVKSKLNETGLVRDMSWKLF